MLGDPVETHRPGGETARLTPVQTIGLVLPARRVQVWHLDVVQAIEATGAKVLIAIVEQDPRIRLIGRVGHALLRAYGWVDGAIFGRSGDPTSLADSRAMAFGRADIVAEDRLEPDLVIRLDDAEGPTERWPAPGLGVWALRHGLGLSSAARAAQADLPPGGIEMFQKQSTTVSQLIRTVGGDRQVIGQVVSRVDPLSIRRGSRGHLRKLPGLVARSVAAISPGGDPPSLPPWSQAARRSDDGADFGAVRISAAITGLWGGYFLRLLRRKVERQRWTVAVSGGSDDPRRRELEPFRFLEAPEGIDWADPFPVRTPTADLVFVEEYVTAVGRGRLAVIELDDSPRGWRSVDTILDLPTHLSYPFVFRWASDWYLMPEQAGTGALELYVAESFPRTWRWHSTVLEQPASDATIAQIDGRWWLFAALAVGGGLAADDLHLFHAASPLGPWTAHARNPVSSDVRTARPAGRLNQRDGAWFRVAQDGAISYGHSIAIIRIDRLDLEGYAETVVDVIHPDWAPGIVATHTINGDDGLTAVDALCVSGALGPPISIQGPAPNPAV